MAVSLPGRSPEAAARLPARESTAKYETRSHQPSSCATDQRRALPPTSCSSLAFSRPSTARRIRYSGYDPRKVCTDSSGLPTSTNLTPAFPNSSKKRWPPAWCLEHHPQQQPGQAQRLHTHRPVGIIRVIGGECLTHHTSACHQQIRGIQTVLPRIYRALGCNIFTAQRESQTPLHRQSRCPPSRRPRDVALRERLHRAHPIGPAYRATG